MNNDKTPEQLTQLADILHTANLLGDERRQQVDTAYQNFINQQYWNLAKTTLAEYFRITA